MDLVSTRRTLGDDRRESLIRRIQQVVLADGFATMTVDGLAARLSCSKSTLYALAPTKESLVALAVRRFLEDVSFTTEQAVAAETDPVRRLATYLTAVGAEMSRMSRDCFEDLGANESTRAIYLSHEAAITGRITELVQHGIAARAFRRVDARFVADAVSLLIDGIQWGRLLEGTDMSPGDAYTALKDFVLHAVARA
jgi:AcrR family transcriptional regulator